MSFRDKILKNQSPWGSPPPGGGGQTPGGNGSGSRQDPPSLDDIIKNFQKTINKFSGGKTGGSRPIIIGILILVLLYIASGLYRVLPDEQGVVLRFGKYVNTTQPGLHYHFPTPFDPNKAYGNLENTTKSKKCIKTKTSWRVRQVQYHTQAEC